MFSGTLATNAPSLANAVKDAIHAAQHDEVVTQIRAIQAKPPTRELSQSEIQLLQGNNNTSDNWQNVHLLVSVQSQAWSHIRDCRFRGQVVLGQFGGDVHVDSIPLPDGCYRSTIIDCWIGSGALVSDNLILSQSWVGPAAVIMGCGRITCSGKGTTFGNGHVICVGPETGGRDVPIFATMTLEAATAIACMRDDKTNVDNFDNAVKAYTTAVRSSTNVFGDHSRSFNCPILHDVFIGPYGVFETCEAHDVCALSGPDDDVTRVEAHSHVTHSVLQWGCHVASALVGNSLLLEQSHATEGAKVIGSIVGHSSGIASGECTSSLVGPCVGCHHHSLLIASVWPQGKGNIGYGANIGSNHTGKLNDQELWPGEGMFFGLSTSVKFPSNFVEAPYSMIATGVITLPQRVAFPFALINSSAEHISGISPAFNEISPGWVAGSNMFMLIRNEMKFKQRMKAKRSCYMSEWEVMRCDTVQMCVRARNALRNPKKPHTHALASGEGVFTSDEIPGLGKNYMTESSRLAGEKAYSSVIRVFALRGLLRVIQSADVAVELTTTPEKLPSLPAQHPEHSRWELERSLLTVEYPNQSVATLLTLLVEAMNKTAHSVGTSKAKDDQRGPHTISDYSLVHLPAATSPVIAHAHTQATLTRAAVTSILNNNNKDNKSVVAVSKL
eukprot:c12509_g1_i1.p1 GENE.c12509_g1_i1~~c12509_g1_i1.p1  ORF type:complete len:670 (+),score=186.12 c12509_g1_i1:35-2044(+)